MSLSATEKADIILALGWPAKTIIENSTDYSKIIVDRLGTLTAPFEVQVRDLLGKISKLDSKLDEASCRLSAKIVGDITLRDDEIYQLKKERKRIVNRLSDLLDIEVLSTGSGGICVSV
jgi:hypothetical protein